MRLARYEHDGTTPIGVVGPEDEIGTLTHRIVAGVEPLPVPPARARQGASA